MMSIMDEFNVKNQTQDIMQTALPPHMLKKCNSEVVDKATMTLIPKASHVKLPSMSEQLVARGVPQEVCVLLIPRSRRASCGRGVLKTLFLFSPFKGVCVAT